MKKTLRNTLFRFILLLLFISALEKQAVAEGSLTALVKKVQPAVVTVITFDMDKNVSGIGSGFFVNKEGHLITNHMF